MEQKVLKTSFQIEREERDLAIYKEYKKLMEIEGQSKTAVKVFLMNKYGIHSQGTIYLIIKRVEKRLNGKKYES